MTAPTRDDLVTRDAEDRLRPMRERFAIPDGLVYLDGNSLGAMPKRASLRIDSLMRQEWGRDLIRSWNINGWMNLPRTVGDKIAGLIGAGPGEVVAVDSTSVNLFKVLAGALRLDPGRRVVLSDHGNFPTDLYIANGLIELMGADHELRLVEPEEVAGAIDGDTAVMMLTQVDYRTGRIHDMQALTEAAHAAGALCIWDLSHSAGAMPVDLNGCGADFAVGCGYKYLNGGPGAPAYLFIAARHQAAFETPLPGWLGHRAPFDFTTDYAPAEGIARAVCGTPPVLSLAALECGIDIACEVDMAHVRDKSTALTDAFIALVEDRCEGVELASPRDAAARGSQVCFRHPEGYAIMQALIDNDVIGDFRAPDVMRFGFAPLYVRFVNLWDAVDTLATILDRRLYEEPRFQRRAAVT